MLRVPDRGPAQITGRRLGALDRAMLIPGFGTCGAPEPGEWSSGVLRPTAESTDAMLQITNVQLKAGSYKLCFCDAEVRCRTEIAERAPAVYTVWLCGLLQCIS